MLSYWEDIPKDWKRFSIICGNRKKRKDTILKKLSSKVANKIRKHILKDDCNDSACALKVFRKQDYLKLEYFKNMHRFLPALFKMNGGKVFNVLVDDRERLAGVSKFNFNNRFWIGITDLYRVWILIKKRRKNE
jgi:dolichol-phosphate mannosyltransferase